MTVIILTSEYDRVAYHFVTDIRQNFISEAYKRIKNRVLLWLKYEVD